MGPDVFTDIRILELGIFAAVPYCAELFAHGGAEVIKVEPLNGDSTRHFAVLVPGEGRQFVNKSRGKRSIALNLGSEEGRRVAFELAAQADVVLCNMKPGTPERLGLDYESVARANPRVVYGELTAYGRVGPDANRGGVDTVAQSAAGLLVSDSHVEDDKPSHSSAHEVHLADYHSGTVLAFGVAAALHHRAVTGRGQKVETTLFQGALALQHSAANIIHVVDHGKLEFIRWLKEENPPFEEAYRRRNDELARESWFGNTYQTSDGWISIGGAASKDRLANLLCMDDPALKPGYQMPDDPREDMERLVHLAQAAVIHWTTGDLLAALHEHSIPCSRVRFVEEVLVGEQAVESNFVHNFDHPRLGPVTLLAPPLKFSECAYQPAETTPEIGEDTRAILRRLGYDDGKIDGLVAAGAIGEN